MKKQFITFVSTLFPSQVVSFAYKQLTNPQVKKLREHELAVLETAEKETFGFKDFKIQLYHWQGGQDKVLLIHGWEGQAGNFADLIAPLQQQGYTVYAFDAPSHGFSSKGSTSLMEFTELVGILIRKYGVKKLISHSFGGVATTYALSNNLDLHIDKYVLLTTPDKFIERIQDVKEQIGITHTVQDKLVRRLETETGLDVMSLNVSNFVKKVQVKKALIIHDTNDTVIPIERARNVQRNWQNCELLEIQGTGHFRILRTATVFDKVLTFLNN